MGQQVAFIFLIVFVVLIFTQIILLAKNENKHYNSTLNDIKLIKEKLGIK
jgi:hypothetical protein